MDKHYIDFTNLSDKMKKKTAYRLKDVQSQIKKVAFDVVRFIDSEGLDRLWQVRSVDNEDYIVAMYDELNETVEKTASTNFWRALESDKGLDIFYKGAVVGSINLSSMGFSQEDVSLASQWVPVSLGTDDAFVKNFINTLTASEKDALSITAPELVRN